MVPGWKLWSPGQSLDHGIVDKVIRRITIAGQRQCVDPQPRRTPFSCSWSSRTSLLVSVAMNLSPEIDCTE